MAGGLSYRKAYVYLLLAWLSRYHLVQIAIMKWKVWFKNINHALFSCLLYSPFPLVNWKTDWTCKKKAEMWNYIHTTLTKHSNFFCFSFLWVTTKRSTTDSWDLKKDENASKNIITHSNWKMLHIICLGAVWIRHFLLEIMYVPAGIGTDK